MANKHKVKGNAGNDVGNTSIKNMNGIIKMILAFVIIFSFMVFLIQGVSPVEYVYSKLFHESIDLSDTSVMSVLADDDAVKGNLDAKVTIVEWSDFECSFCARFYRDTLPSIQKDYIDTGKVKFIFRDFPLEFHTSAQKASEAAECAGEQDSYYLMHDMLFENGVFGGVDSYKRFASDLGLDRGAFDECLDSGIMANEIAKDLNDGKDVGVKGTPAFIINGQFISGAQPYSVFKDIIDKELASVV
ncbi:MAG: DsbA family protein [DPANN group archaeon]|nr:DsbA family protein [DPANN group archaeon]